MNDTSTLTRICPRDKTTALRRIVGFLSLLIVATTVSSADAIDPAGLFHDYGRFYLRPSEPAAGDLVTVRFQTRHQNATACTLFVKPAGAAVQPCPMVLETTGQLDTWTASFLMPAQTTA